MRLTKKLSILTALLCLCISTLISGIVLMSVKANDNTPEYSISFTEESRLIGTELHVPLGTATLNGQEYELKHSLAYPDGRKTSNDRALLDVVGDYTLTYSFTVGQTPYSKNYSFDVYKNSSTFFSTENKVTLTENAVSPDVYPETYTGLGVTVGNNGKLRYNNIIDFSDNTASTPLLSMLFAPSSVGSEELLRVRLTFTDCFNPDNKLFIEIRSGSIISYPKETQMIAWANDQKEVFYNWLSIPMSFALISDNKLPVEVYFDYSTFTLYAAVKGGGLLKLNELKNLTNGDKDWAGFSSGLAYMDVSFDLISNNANIIILSVDGLAMTSQSVADERNEKISMQMDTLGYHIDSLPLAVKGYTYPVYQAKATSSLYGELPITKSVVLDPDGELVPVIDGRFSTDKVGAYKLLYDAVSPSGTPIKKFLKVVCIEEYQIPLSYEFSSDILSTATIFDKVFIYDGEAVGGVGDITLTSTVKVGGQTCEVRNEGYYDYFIPTSVGEYVIETTVTDFLGKKDVFTKTISVSAPNSSNIIFDKVNMPKSVVVGYPLNIPTINAYDVTSGQKVPAPITVLVNGDEYTGKTYVPETVGAITVTYKSGVATKVYTVQAIEKKSNETNFVLGYYYSEQGQFLIGGTTNRVEYTSASALSSWSFANPVATGKISLNFQFTNKENVNNIKFYFRDYEIGENVVEVEIEVGNTSNYLIINGNQRIPFEYNFFNGYGVLEYNNYTQSISLGGVSLGKIIRTAYGEAFNGFDSRYAYLECEITSNGGSYRMIIDELCGHLMSGAKRDGVAPTITFIDDVPAIYSMNLGESMQMFDAYAYDVINFLADLTIVIQDEAGNEIHSCNLDDGYAFTPTAPGTYYVKYVAFDGRNTSDPSITVYVNAPKIDMTLTGNYATTARKGDTCNLAGIKSNQYVKSVTYLVVTPNGKYVEVTSNSYQFTERGRHFVFVIATDVLNNRTVAKYSVEVK